MTEHCCTAQCHVRVAAGTWLGGLLPEALGLEQAAS